MAFHENPNVDSSSERSEESVLKVKSVFTRKAKFITREEMPDYGVDLGVELVNHNGASSNVFPIQIKSAENVEIIQYESIPYISVQFKTSRLGYLCRRPPTFGIIVIYDDQTQIAYYDYVEEIVNRLTLHRGDNNWKNQADVNIRIPLNKLNPEAAILIHQKMTARFDNHKMLLSDFGHLYRIPSFVENNEKKIDFSNPQQAEKILKEIGLDLFNSKAFAMINDLLSKLPLSLTTGSKELTLIAAITYGQIGMIIECEYYLEKSKSHLIKFNEDETFLLDYTRLMVNFKKGNLSITEFKESLIVIKTKSKGILNTLNLDINLIYLQFLENDINRNNEVLLTAINEVFIKIDESNLSKADKMLLKLFNLENLHNYGTGLFLRDAGLFKIQQKLRVNVSMTERLKRVRPILNVIQEATLQTHNILNESIESNDRIVIAFASYYKARFFFMLRFHTMMLAIGEEEQKRDQPTMLYEGTLNFCYQSVSLFNELSMWYEAHQSLCCAYDLQILHLTLYGSVVAGKTVEEIELTMRRIETATGIRRYESIVESTFNSLSKEGKNHASSWGDVPNDQVEKYARLALEAFGLPEERLVHIMAEINAYRKFYSICTNPDLELLLDLSHEQSKETHYSSTPIFIIRSKKSGIESRKNNNIDNLLSQFSNILKKPPES